MKSESKIIGRPPFYGQRMRDVNFKLTSEQFVWIDQRAAELGISKAELYRLLVDQEIDRLKNNPT